jgi:hypothetical protein
VAIVTKAPFYVPKQPDHAVWMGRPIASLTLHLPVPPANLSGTTIRPPFWIPTGGFDTSSWAPTPETLNAATLTITKLLAAATPFTFESQWAYRYDETPPWNAAPFPSGAIVATRTQVKFYGQPGQAPYRWSNWTYDETAPWAPFPESLNSYAALYAPTITIVQMPRAPFYALRSSEDYLWQGTPTANSAIRLTTTQVKFFGQPGQTPPFRWNWSYDDPAIWVGAPRSVNTNTLPSGKNPFSFESQWPYRYDDTAPWNAAPLPSGAIVATRTQVKFYGQPGQAPYRWSNWTYDDPPPWNARPFPSGAIVATRTQGKFYGQPGQVPPFRWNWGYDEQPAPWYPTPETLNTPPGLLALLSTPIPINVIRAPFYFSRPASEEIWVGAPIAVNINTKPPTGPNPFSFESQWPYRYDETASWSPNPETLNANYSLLKPQPFSFELRGPYTYDETALWVGAPRSVNISTLPTGLNPFSFESQWSYRYDDTAPWNATPLPSGAITATRTQIKFYGQPGQAPYRWSNWTYDETAPWNAKPLPSGAIVATRTQIKLYGQPGQASPFRWNWSYDEQPAPWYPTPETLNAPPGLLATLIAPVPINIIRAPFYFSRPASEEIWVGAPRNVNINTIPATVLNPFSFEPRWSYTYDETSSWQWPTYTATLFPLSMQLYALPASISFSYDDPPTWQWNIFGRNPNILKVVPPPPFSFESQWPYRYDETAPWSPNPETLNANYSLLKSQPFSFELRWPYTYDETAPWNAAPISSRAIVVTTTQVKFYGQPGQAPPFRWNATGDDAASWQWPNYSRNDNILGIPPPPPFSNAQSYRWTFDDASLWQGTPLPSGAIVATRTQVRFYGQPGQAPYRWSNWTYNDPPVWTWPGATWNHNVLFQIVYPKINPPIQWYSEDAYWLGTPLSSRAIVLTNTQAQFFGQHGQVPPFRWNWGLNDPPVWQWAIPQRNVDVLIPVIVEPFSNSQAKRWTYDDASLWQGVPTRSQIIRLLSTQQRFYSAPGQVPTPRWARYYVLDDPPMWQGSPTRSFTLPLLTTQLRMYGAPGEVLPRWWRYDYDDASLWNWPTTELNLPLLYNIFVPPPGPSAQVLLAFGTVSGMTIRGVVSAFLPEGTVEGGIVGGIVN